MKLLVAFAVLYAIWWLNKQRRPSLSLKDARDLLGVGAGATAEEIGSAHRKLIARVHPDAGGTAALAARVNAARDLLLADRAPSARR